MKNTATEGNTYQKLTFERRFSRSDDIKEQVPSETRDAIFNDHNGSLRVLKDIEVPSSWSQRALNVTGMHYLRREGVPRTGYEKSVYIMAERVTETIREWGVQQGYFDEDNSRIFERELRALILEQRAAFNSPVYYNVGLMARYGIDNPFTKLWGIDEEEKAVQLSTAYEHPLVSACYIYNPGDSLDSLVLAMAVDSTTIFEFGAGIGGAWDNVRETGALIKGGGYASGPISFLAGQNADAGAIKSGGRTRRAAIMAVLGTQHPDIERFVTSKVISEIKGRILLQEGSPNDWESHTFQELNLQNVNMSVGAEDGFFEAVYNGGDIELFGVKDRRIRKANASKLLDLISYCAWECGDPGIQYRDRINAMNTCAADGRIIASNPCSEFLFLDKSACNLAALNLVKFRKDGKFDIEGFRAAVRIMSTAQDILISRAGYPTGEIATNSHSYRPLGLGFANLGSYIMREGLPYDNEEARRFAAVVTSLMTSEAYRQSTRIAQVLGPFARYETNKESVLAVLKKHRDSSAKLRSGNGLEVLIRAANENWENVIASAEKTGIRNAQVTLLAPTGTTGFMMDCDTFGIEPEMALVKEKVLSGNQGRMRIVNTAIPDALVKLGYNEKEITEIHEYILSNGTIEGCKELKAGHLSVFDCSMLGGKGTRTITPEGHIRMMAAVQPFLSGGISKTVNVPENTTPMEIRRLYEWGHELGLKALALYRDGSKGSQPVTAKAVFTPEELKRGEKRKPGHKRDSVTFGYSVAGINTFFTVGLYESGDPCEIFINVLNRGEEIDILVNTVAREASNLLQFGAPLERVIELFETSGQSKEYGGLTDHPFIRFSKGFLPFIGDVLRAEFLGDISNISKELRPLPWELEVFRRKPALHLYPTIGGVKIYPGSPSLEETIESVLGDGNNPWQDEGLDTYQTIRRIIEARRNKEVASEEKLKRGKLIGRYCTCGSPMMQNGPCVVCSNPSCGRTEGRGCGA
jgi:ribonucleoside-diphosphate reductase alpha chain